MQAPACHRCFVPAPVVSIRESVDYIFFLLSINSEGSEDQMKMTWTGEMQYMIVAVLIAIFKQLQINPD